MLLHFGAGYSRISFLDTSAIHSQRRQVRLRDRSVWSDAKCLTTSRLSRRWSARSARPPLWAACSNGQCARFTRRPIRSVPLITRIPPGSTATTPYKFGAEVWFQGNITDSRRRASIDVRDLRLPLGATALPSTYQPEWPADGLLLRQFPAGRRHLGHADRTRRISAWANHNGAFLRRIPGRSPVSSLSIMALRWDLCHL